MTIHCSDISSKICRESSPFQRLATQHQRNEVVEQRDNKLSELDVLNARTPEAIWAADLKALLTEFKVTRKRKAATDPSEPKIKKQRRIGEERERESETDEDESAYGIEEEAEEDVDWVDDEGEEFFNSKQSFDGTLPATSMSKALFNVFVQHNFESTFKNAAEFVEHGHRLVDSIIKKAGKKSGKGNYSIYMYQNEAVTTGNTLFYIGMSRRMRSRMKNHEYQLFHRIFDKKGPSSYIKMAKSLQHNTFYIRRFEIQTDSSEIAKALEDGIIWGLDMVLGTDSQLTNILRSNILFNLPELKYNVENAFAFVASLIENMMSIKLHEIKVRCGDHTIPNDLVDRLIIDCPECEKKFHSVRPAIRHMEMNHPESNERVESGKCTFKSCKRLFNKDSTMQRHIKILHPVINV